MFSTALGSRQFVAARRGASVNARRRPANCLSRVRASAAEADGRAQVALKVGAHGVADRPGGLRRWSHSTLTHSQTAAGPPPTSTRSSAATVKEERPIRDTQSEARNGW